jgi:hypothetical protein
MYYIELFLQFKPEASQPKSNGSELDLEKRCLFGRLFVSSFYMSKL